MTNVKQQCKDLTKNAFWHLYRYQKGHLGCLRGDKNGIWHIHIIFIADVVFLVTWSLTRTT